MEQKTITRTKLELFQSLVDVTTPEGYLAFSVVPNKNVTMYNDWADRNTKTLEDFTNDSFIIGQFWEYNIRDKKTQRWMSFLNMENPKKSIYAPEVYATDEVKAERTALVLVDPKFHAEVKEKFDREQAERKDYLAKSKEAGNWITVYYAKRTEVPSHQLNMNEWEGHEHSVYFYTANVHMTTKEITELKMIKPTEELTDVYFKLANNRDRASANPLLAETYSHPKFNGIRGYQVFVETSHFRP